MSLGAVAGSPTPQYWPTCGSPQNIAPMQTLGGFAPNMRSAVVWNGQNYAVVWVDSSGLSPPFPKGVRRRCPVRLAGCCFNKSQFEFSMLSMEWERLWSGLGGHEHIISGVFRPAQRRWNPLCAGSKSLLLWPIRNDGGLPANSGLEWKHLRGFPGVTFATSILIFSRRLSPRQVTIIGHDLVVCNKQL